MRSFWLLGALCLFAASSAAQEIGKVKFLAGPVTVSRGGAISNAAAGDALRANDIVRTGAAAGNGARLVLLDASELTLGPGTEMRVIQHNPDTQQTTIEMLHGHLRAKVTPVVKQGGIFQVRTPTAIAVALGTVVDVSTAPILDTTSTQTAANVSESQISSIPSVTRDFGQLATLTPGAPAAGKASATNLDGVSQMTQAASNSIFDRDDSTSDLNGYLDATQIQPGSSGFVSLTDLARGTVADVRPDSSGYFHFDGIAGGNYSVRAQGFHLNSSIQSRISVPGGASVNLGTLSADTGNQPGSPVTKLQPDYSYRPTSYISKFELSTKFRERSYFESASAPAFAPDAAASNAISLPNLATGVSNYFNSQTQSFNALTPFTTAAPGGASAAQSLNLNLLPRFTSPSSNSSTWSQKSIGGPVPLPRFGEGSSSVTPRHFFFSQTETVSGPRAPGLLSTDFLSSPAPKFTFSGMKLGDNYSYNVPPIRDFTFSASGAATSSPALPFSNSFTLSDLDNAFSSYAYRESLYKSRWNSFFTSRPIPSEELPNYRSNSITDRTPSFGAFSNASGNFQPDYNRLLTPKLEFNLNFNRALDLDFSIPPTLDVAAEFRSEGELRAPLRAYANQYSQRQPAVLFPDVPAESNFKFTPGYGNPFKISTQASSAPNYGLLFPDSNPGLLRDFQPKKFTDSFENYDLGLRRYAESPTPEIYSLAPATRSAEYAILDRIFMQREQSYERWVQEGYQYFLEDLYHMGYANEFSYPSYSDYTDFLDWLDYYYGDDDWDYDDLWNYMDDLAYYDDYGPLAGKYDFPSQYFGDYYGKKIVEPDYANLRLEQIEPGLTQRVSGRLGLWSYTGVSVTIVIALDHWVAVGSYVPGSRTQYGQSGQMIIVRVGQAAEPPVAVLHPNGSTGTLLQASLKNVPTAESLLREMVDFNATGACTPTYFLNGVVLFGGSTTAVSYKLLGTGSSTGQVIRVLVTNNTNCAVYFMVSFGAVLQPHSLEHKIGAALSLLLGNNLNVNNIKSYQIMINFGGTTIAIIVVPPPSPPQHPADMGGHVSSDAGSAAESASEQLPPNVFEGFLRSYCLELHKLAPHPETRYDFADAKLQDELGPNAAFLQHIFEMVQSGALKIPPGHSLDSLIQWTLWASREGMDESKFMDAYMTLVHHNYDAQKRKWDKDAQKQMEESGKGLWPAVAMALAAK